MLQCYHSTKSMFYRYVSDRVLLVLDSGIKEIRLWAEKL